MYYTKARIGENAVINTEIDSDNVYNLCPRCGAECAVDLSEIIHNPNFSLYETATYCEECAKIVMAEQEAEKRRLNGTCRDAAYFDTLTAAMETAEKVWEADGISPRERIQRLQAAFPEFLPKLPPEAFPNDG